MDQKNGVTICLVTTVLCLIYITIIKITPDAATPETMA